MEEQNENHSDDTEEIFPDTSGIPEEESAEPDDAEVDHTGSEDKAQEES